ncbi:hypothetical protein BJ170DRAFT_599381 [Xylariales sp. AK1849]|nr:hypothetical protein BJ170DRAFT_599381 [Xylariales sp. AK1849]
MPISNILYVVGGPDLTMDDDFVEGTAVMSGLLAMNSQVQAIDGLGYREELTTAELLRPSFGVDIVGGQYAFIKHMLDHPIRRTQAVIARLETLIESDEDDHGDGFIENLPLPIGHHGNHPHASQDSLANTTMSQLAAAHDSARSETRRQFAASLESVKAKEHAKMEKAISLYKAKLHSLLQTREANSSMINAATHMHSGILASSNIDAEPHRIGYLRVDGLMKAQRDH